MKRYQIIDKVTLDFGSHTLVLTPAYHDLFIQAEGKKVWVVTCHDGGEYCGERQESLTSIETLKGWIVSGEVVEVKILKPRRIPTRDDFWLGFSCGCSFAILCSLLAELFR